MLSQWIISVFIVLYVISGVLVVNSIGKPKRPLSSGQGAGMIVLISAEVVALVYVLLHL